MSISPYKTFVSGEVLTASDLNASFTQITNNGRSLVSPLTGTLDMDGYELILDADADTSITADTDDRIDFKINGVDLFIFNGTTASVVNGLTFLASATANAVQVQAQGSDSNVSINLVPKGSGTLQYNGNEVGTTGATTTFTSTDAAAAVGPVIVLDRNSASPAAADLIGGVQFKGRDSGAGTDTYAQINAEIDDPTAASEDGAVSVRVAVAGTLSEVVRIAAAGQTITSTDAGAAVGPLLVLDRNSASPANSDVLGGVRFSGRDGGAGTDTYALIQAEIVDVTAASEDGALSLQTAVDGTLAERVRVAARTAIKNGFDLSGVISPAQLTANTDDWAPTGIATATVIRFSTDASRNITGLTGGADGRIIVLHNVGAQNAVLKDETTSTAANRFALTGDITIPADGVVALQYDGTTTRWRSVSVPVVAGTGGVTVSGNTVSIPAPVVIQVLSMTIAEATGTTAIPIDDTIPLSTEGTEIGTQAITLADNTNKVLIHGAIQAGYELTNASVVIAVFRGTTCISSRVFTDSGAAVRVVIPIEALDSPATAGSVTYSVRVGGSTAGQTWYAGAHGSSDLGGTTLNGLILSEISAS